MRGPVSSSERRLGTVQETTLADGVGRGSSWSIGLRSVSWGAGGSENGGKRVRSREKQYLRKNLRPF